MVESIGDNPNYWTTWGLFWTTSDTFWTTWSLFWTTSDLVWTTCDAFWTTLRFTLFTTCLSHDHLKWDFLKVFWDKKGGGTFTRQAAQTVRDWLQHARAVGTGTAVPVGYCRAVPSPEGHFRRVNANYIQLSKNCSRHRLGEAISFNKQ